MLRFQILALYPDEPLARDLVPDLSVAEEPLERHGAVEGRERLDDAALAEDEARASTPVAPSGAHLHI